MRASALPLATASAPLVGTDTVLACVLVVDTATADLLEPVAIAAATPPYQLRDKFVGISNSGMRAAPSSRYDGIGSASSYARDP